MSDQTTPTEELVGDELKHQQERDFVRQINYGVQACYQNSINHGFWRGAEELAEFLGDAEAPVDLSVTLDELVIGQKLLLMHSEISEALEALRAPIKQDQHLPTRISLHVELADIVIRIMDLSGKLNVPLGEIIVEKMAFNKSRPHKHGKLF